ncbi:MAG: hypothetical protein ING29_04800 [Azospirillum sp.]|nr:hypothetical protein [Azospirillum sp.]
MSHPIRLFFEVLGTLVALALVGVALLLWRLSAGPIAVPFVTPLLEAALAAEESPFEIDVGETWLDWSGLSRSMELRISGTSVRDRQGRAVATIPEAWLSISARRLWRMELQPESLRVAGLHLRLTRDANGDIRLFETDDSGAQTGTGGALAFLVEELSGPPDTDKPLGLLARVELENLIVDVDDALTGLSLSLVEARAAATRDNAGIALTARLPIRLGDQTVAIDLRALYAAQNEEIRLLASTRGVWLPGFAGLDPRLAHLAGVRARPDLDVEAVVRAGKLEAGRVALRARAATIAERAWFAGEIAVDEAVLDARVSADFKRIDVERLELDLSGTKLRASAAIEELLARPKLTARVELAELPTGRLVELWPVFAPENPRIWIADNIAGGRVPQARAEIELTARDAEWSGTTLGRFRLDFAVRGASVTYVHGLPPIRGADANATMDARRLDFRVTAGSVGGIRLEEGTVALTGLDQYQQYAQVDARLAAPVGEAMRLIDREPLGFLQRIGETPDNFAGEASVRLNARFPLLADLKLDALQIRVDAQTRGFTMRNAVLGQPLEDGEIAVRVDNDGLDARGRGTLAGSPAEIVYRREFSATANPIERATARGRASAETQRRLNLDFPPYIDGPVGVELATTAARDGRRTIDLALDLEATTLRLPEFDFERKAGTPLRARMQVALLGDTVVEIRNIDASGPGLALRGRIGFAPDGRTMADIDLSRALIEGRADLSALRVRRDRAAAGGRGRNVFEARGAFLDVEFFLKDKSPPDPARPDLALQGRFERMRLGEDRELKAVSLDGRRGQRLWEQLRLEARMDPSTPGATARVPFVFALEPGAEGLQRLSARSADAGAVLKALDVSPNVVGGTLTIEGRTDPARPDQAIAGTANIRDFRLKNAPAMAKLLSVALLTGVLDSLRGDGIGFSRLDAEFLWADPQIEIKDGRMYGAAIGITAGGKVDLQAETLDLAGTIVPAYAVNSILGNIPILGDLLAGERGGGIFAANYVARGGTAEPDIRINPLSTLAPGFLRRLFGGLGGGGAGSAQTPAPDGPVNPDR